jgi:hypothetical protein
VLDSASRIDLLRSHPALVARLFEFKQDCIWKYLVMGEAKPFGEVTDYWRRVEVFFITWALLYHMYNILYTFILV